MICLAGWLWHLLPQEIKRRQLVRSFFVDIKIDIVTSSLGRPKSVKAARREQLILRDFVEQFLGIIKELACLGADRWIVENRRIASTQFPRVKEGRPIDE